MKHYNINIKFVKCHPDAQLPTQSEGDVGFDLYASESIYILPGETRGVPTGIKLAAHVERLFVYENTDEGRILAAAVPFFKIEGRSGLARKWSLFPIGGIVDPSYRGEIVAIMHNGGNAPYSVVSGDRIAQMVCYLTFANSNPITVTVKEVEEVSATERGDKGFGSSGV